MADIGPHLSLPDTAREQMREPLGPVIAESGLALHVRQNDTIITVGDMVTLTLAGAGYPVALAVFDFKTLRNQGRDLRERLSRLGGDRVRARNPPATITAELWDAIEAAFLAVKAGARVLLEVEGEEDLAAIPAILLAPDGAKVLYGMPGRGMVLVSVDERTRRMAARLLGLMVPREGWEAPTFRQASGV